MPPGSRYLHSVPPVLPLPYRQIPRRRLPTTKTKNKESSLGPKDQDKAKSFSYITHIQQIFYYNKIENSVASMTFHKIKDRVFHNDDLHLNTKFSMYGSVVIPTLQVQQIDRRPQCCTIAIEIYK